METLDLVQLHCPPTDLFYHPEVFAALDDLVAAGAIAHYGVSVERVEEGLKSLDFPGVASVQIIYNIFRQRPAERFLAAAKAADVGVIVRVPLSSGMLTGKITREQPVLARRPPQLQPARRGVRRGRDVLPASPSRPVSPPSRRCAPSCPPVSRWRCSPCASAFPTRESRRSSPEPRTPSRPDRTPSPASSGRSTRRHSSSLARIYREQIAPEVHYRW